MKLTLLQPYRSLPLVWEAAPTEGIKALYHGVNPGVLGVLQWGGD